MPVVELELLLPLEEWRAFEAEPVLLPLLEEELEVFRPEPSEYARLGVDCPSQSRALWAARFGLAACSAPVA